MEDNFFKKFKNYIEVFVVLLVMTLSIMCFLPICNGSYFDYKKTITPNPDEIDEETANKIKEEATKEIENSTTDTLVIQREISDVVNSLIFDLRNEKYDDAYLLLDEPSYKIDSNSFKYTVDYNKDFKFFRTYLGSFEININQVTVLDDVATCNLTFKRYDINRMVNKLISDKTQEGIDLEKETYESVLFEYENYLRDEFSKSNAYVRQTDIIIGLMKKPDGTWKIVNDDSLTQNLINLDFQIVKTFNGVN